MRRAPVILILRGVLMVTLAGSAVLAAGCEDDSAGPERGVTIDDVTDGDVPVGQQVTVSGEVSSVVTPNLFTLGGDDLGGESLSVISAQPTDVAEDDVVRVTGIVRLLGDSPERFEDEWEIPWVSDYEGLMVDPEQRAVKAEEVDVLESQNE